MSADRVVREQLLALLNGGNAHVTFEQAVADFPVQHINSKANGFEHSAWELLEHLRICQWDIVAFIRNPSHQSPEWPAGYWPAPAMQADAAQWQRCHKQFRTDLKALKELVTASDTDFYSDLPHAPGYSILREILIVADHNSYHLGQLVMLRKLLGIWQEK